MVSAETASRGEDIGTPGDILNKGNDFVSHIGIVGVVSNRALRGLNRFIEPRFVVSASDGEQHAFSGFDEIGDAIDHAEILVFVEATAGGWKDENGFSGMAVDVECHVFVKGWTKPVMIFFFHEES